MYKFPIGVIIDSFRTDTFTAIRKAAELGANGIQMYSTDGENSPENLTAKKRKELLCFVKDNNLKFSALCGDLGMGFFNKEMNPKLIEKSKRILDLAKELETDIVTTHIGVVPEDETVDRYKIMQEACFELSRYADSIGSHFAIETGPETSAVLKKFLDSLGFIIFNTYHNAINSKHLLDKIDALYNVVSVFHTLAVVGRKVGFTLGAVYN